MARESNPVGIPTHDYTYPCIESPEHPFLVRLNSDYVAYQLPISVKAVIRWGNTLPLLKNERDEWELPGGRLELGEHPADCLRREVREELGWDVTFTNPSHAWVYQIRPEEHVFIVTYFGRYSGSSSPLLSTEHSAFTLASREEALALRMPGPYKEAIDLAFEAE